MAAKKKTAKKAKVQKNFVVLDASMNGCCGERFATQELAQAEATRHVQSYGDDVYYVAQLMAKVSQLPPEEQPVNVETL